jgi:hypothetical protein
MRRPVQYALIALAILLGGASIVLYSQNQKTKAEYAQVKASEESVRTKYAETIDAIAEIQDSLSTIETGEAGLKATAKGLQTEQQLSGPDGQEALDRIALLRASIMRSRERIEKLETDLQKSGVKVAGLQRMITNLKDSVTEKETQVAQLEQRVQSLETEVTTLATQVQETQDTVRVRDITLEERRKELATVYYVVGSKDALAAHGIIEAKGGVLGMGKTLRPSGTAPSENFIPLDTDSEDRIRITAEKAKVLSAQPHSSYEMIVEDGQIVLHITDPVEFRKIRQLVILTS